MTLTVDGALARIDQVAGQADKLVNVLKIEDLQTGSTVARELALFQLFADGAQRGELMPITEILRSRWSM